MNAKLLLGIGLSVSAVVHTSNASYSGHQGEVPPNLIIIHTDEHNFRTLGCYRRILPEDEAFVWGRGVKVDTPNIDWLADNGALCASFYATTPVCSPSRASLLTGCYPQKTAVVDNNIPLKDDALTIAELLRRKGYATGYAGKWHLDGPGKPGWRPERKFGFVDNRYMFNRGHWKMIVDTPEGPHVIPRDRHAVYTVPGADAANYTTDYLTGKALEFIDTNKDLPFCFMLSFPDPHDPNCVRAPYDTMYMHVGFVRPPTPDAAGATIPKWAWTESKKAILAANTSGYFGMVKCIDDNVGRLLKALRESGLLANTIIVFTADHGDMAGEHGMYGKGVPYEASARIPFILYCPTKVRAGTLVDEAMTCVDFLPTVLSLMGFEVPETVQGHDCSILFTLGRSPACWKDVAFMRSAEKATGTLWLAAVTSRYKLILSSEDEPWLFDLARDPAESVNLYQDPTLCDIVRQLSVALLEYGLDFSDPYALNKHIRLRIIRASGR